MPKFITIFLLSLMGLNGPNLRSEIAISKTQDDLYFVLEKLTPDSVIEWLQYEGAAEKKAREIQTELVFIPGVAPVDQLIPDLERLKNVLTPTQLQEYRQLYIQSKLTPLDRITDPDVLKVVNKTDKSEQALRKTYEIFKALYDGLSNFKRALNNINAKTDDFKSDVWVAYIISKNPASYNYNSDKTNDIEMAFAVLAKEGSPLTMHMGIARNPFNLINSTKEHPRISTQLHAFAAKVILAKYKEARFMITTPVSSMAKLFKEVLPEENYAEGMNKKGAWIIRDDTYKPLTGIATWHPFYENGFRFQLYDRDIESPNKELVLSLVEANKNQYGWLFNRLHDSLNQHPYFVAKLAGISSLFPADFVIVP
jgi:hypothetical protein